MIKFRYFGEKSVLAASVNKPFIHRVGRNRCLQVLALCIIIITIWYFLNKPEDIIYTSTTKPIVFVGGYPRSGTTLMRVLLDIHPKIRCGPESRVIPKILSARAQLDTPVEIRRLQAANLYPSVIDNATRAFVYTVIENNGKPAYMLCNKDPLSYQYITYMSSIFPQAKFINMVRDGRAVVSSIIKRNVRIKHTPKDPKDLFKHWENRTWDYFTSCTALGENRCMTIKYENLVLRPSETMHKVFEFLNMEWTPAVLHHEKYIESETFLSRLEPSTSQVKNPINLASLTMWASNESGLPKELIHHLHETSYVLEHFGYSKMGVPPNYGTPESSVANQPSYTRKKKK